MNNSDPSKQDILNLISTFIKNKHKSKTWVPGKDWVQYAGPFFDDSEYINAVGTLLEEWLVLGKDAITFENEFPKYLGKSCGVVVNSGSSANLIMMLTAKKYFNLSDGDKIIIPAAGFPTTLNPILQSKLTPVFVDIELDTLNLNIEQVESAAKNGAKAIMFAHVLGNPPNMERLLEIKNKYNLIFLEDCCDALGSKYNNEPVGKHGDMATCSFYPAHHMTMGEGGFVACNNKEQEIIARSLREWGRGCYCVGKKANLSINGSCGCRFKNWLSEFPDEIFDHKYIYENIGFNLKPIELQCSIGLSQLKKLEIIHQKRKENYNRLFEIFEPYQDKFIIHRATDKSDPSWFAFPLTLKDDSNIKRYDFTSFLEKNKIQTRNYFGGNLLLQPAYSDVESISYNNIKVSHKNAKEIFPVSTKVTTDTLFLGTSPIITNVQLDYVKNIVDSFFKK